MLASLESAVPIIASVIFTNLYNATSELSYPWQGSFYIASIGFSSLGIVEISKSQNNTYNHTIILLLVSGSIITLFVFASLGFKQIKSEDEEEGKTLKKPGSKLETRDEDSSKC